MAISVKAQSNQIGKKLIRSNGEEVRIMDSGARGYKVEGVRKQIPANTIIIHNRVLHEIDDVIDEADVRSTEKGYIQLKSGKSDNYVEATETESKDKKESRVSKGINRRGGDKAPKNTKSNKPKKSPLLEKALALSATKFRKLFTYLVENYDLEGDIPSPEDLTSKSSRLRKQRIEWLINESGFDEESVEEMIADPKAWIEADIEAASEFSTADDGFEDDDDEDSDFDSDDEDSDDEDSDDEDSDDDDSDDDDSDNDGFDDEDSDDEDSDENSNIPEYLSELIESAGSRIGDEFDANSQSILMFKVSGVAELPQLASGVITASNVIGIKFLNTSNDVEYVTLGFAEGEPNRLIMANCDTKRLGSVTVDKKFAKKYELVGTEILDDESEAEFDLDTADEDELREEAIRLKLVSKKEAKSLDEDELYELLFDHLVEAEKAEDEFEDDDDVDSEEDDVDSEEDDDDSEEDDDDSDDDDSEEDDDDSDDDDSDDDALTYDDIEDDLVSGLDIPNFPKHKIFKEQEDGRAELDFSMFSAADIENLAQNKAKAKDLEESLNVLHGVVAQPLRDLFNKMFTNVDVKLQVSPYTQDGSWGIVLSHAIETALPKLDIEDYITNNIEPTEEALALISEKATASPKFLAKLSTMFDVEFTQPNIILRDSDMEDHYLMVGAKVVKRNNGKKSMRYVLQCITTDGIDPLVVTASELMEEFEILQTFDYSEVNDLNEMTRIQILEYIAQNANLQEAEIQEILDSDLDEVRKIYSVVIRNLMESASDEEYDDEDEDLDDEDYDSDSDELDADFEDDDEDDDDEDLEEEDLEEDEDEDLEEDEDEDDDDDLNF